jgi:hypothetical protein
MKFSYQSMLLLLPILSVGCSGDLEKTGGSSLSTITQTAPTVEGYTSQNPWKLWIKPADCGTGELKGEADVISSLQTDGVELVDNQNISVQVKLGATYLFKYQGDMLDNNASSNNVKVNTFFYTEYCSADYQDDIGGSVNENGWYALEVTSENKDKIAVPVCADDGSTQGGSRSSDVGTEDVSVSPVVVMPGQDSTSSNGDDIVGTVIFYEKTKDQKSGSAFVMVNPLKSKMGRIIALAEAHRNNLSSYTSKLTKDYAICAYNTDAPSSPGYYIGPENGQSYNFGNNASGSSFDNKADAYTLVQANSGHNCPAQASLN